MLQNTENQCRVSQEEQNLKLIDAAIDTAKQAVHACRSQAAKAHLEYVLAYLNEAWIAESGQQSRKARLVFNDVIYVQSVEAAFSQS